MDSDMTQAKILAELEDKHAKMTALLATMDERQMLQPNVYDGLSLKDVLAHIVAWERRMMDWLETALRGDTPVIFTPGFEVSVGGPEETFNQVMNDFNAHIYLENKNRPLAEVLEDFNTTHAEVLKAVHNTDENDLMDPDRFAWRRGRPFWFAVLGCGYGHYQEHIELIEAWLQRGEAA